MKIQIHFFKSLFANLAMTIIMLAPSVTFGQVTLDNFTDGDYTSTPSWTVVAGTASVTSGALVTNTSTTTGLVMYTPFTIEANQWSFDIKSSNSANLDEFRYYFILKDNGNPTNATADGYCVDCYSNGGDVYLYRLDNSVKTQLGYFDGTNWYTTTAKITVSRDASNIFKVFVDGALRITSSADATYSNASVQYQAIHVSENTSPYTYTVDNIEYSQNIIGTLGTTYTYNFDHLLSTGTGIGQTAGIFFDGWSFLEAGTNANTTYDAGTGASATGNTYSFGVAGTNSLGDRAFGMLQSGSLTSILGYKFKNNTASIITSLTIGYTGELWRLSSASDSLAFSYQPGDIALNAPNGWIDVSALNFTTPVTGPAAAVDGNNSTNRTVISPVTISGLSIASGATVTLRWVDASASSSAGMGIDNFSISGTASTATPTLIADITNNDVDNNIDITYVDDATWRTAITSVKIDGIALTATTDYVISSGNLQLKPSGLNTLLTTSGSKSVTVEASGFTNASVIQIINPGIPAKLAMNTQPTAPASNGGVLVIQPSVNIQDQYGNATTSTASVLAAVGAGVWTLGGTVSVAGIAGTTTYSGLTATSVSSVTGATIAFSSSGLIGVTSAPFNIPLFMSAPSAPTSLTFASVTYNSFTASFTAPTTAPSGYLVLRNTGSAVSGTPVLGNEYIFGQTNIGSGTNEVVYVGSSVWNNYPQTSLTNSTTYYYAVYSYNGSGASTIYSTALTGNQTTAGVPVLSVDTIINVACYGGNNGSITLNPATGGSGTGYEYAMRNPAHTGNWGTWQSALIFNNLSFSTYGFKTKDGNGNESIEIVANITQSSLLTGTVRTSNPLCYASSTGTISINGTSGGNGSYQFSINSGGAWQISPIFNNLNAGIYDVWIKDGNNCTRDLDGTINTTLTNPILLVLDTVYHTNVSECYGNNNGTINIVGTGGNGTKLYSINNGSTWQISNSFTILTAGDYQIKLKDVTCELIYVYNPITITEPSQLNADIATTNPTTANNGIIQVHNLFGGSGVYQAWITGSTWQTAPCSFTGLTAGTYTIKIRDANNITCERTLSSNIVLIRQNGIEDTNNDNNISFIDDYLIINKFKNSNIQIFNTLGQKLYNEIKNDDGTLKLNLSNYLTGYYILKINTINIYTIKKFFKK